LETRRHSTLRACGALSILGTFLAFLGFLGGFASGGFLLKALPWATVTTRRGTFTGGIRHVCNFEKGKCFELSSFDCDTTLDAHACEVCKVGASGAFIPVILTLVTYLTFGRNTWKRYTGDDSAQIKLMSCFAGLFGGATILSVLIAYWDTCVRFQVAREEREAQIGPGLVCIGVGASLLKLVCGALHLGLPVEEPGVEKPLKAGIEEAKTNDVSTA